MNVIILCYPFCHYNMDKSNVKYTESATTTTIAAVFNKSNVSPRESDTMTRIGVVFNENYYHFCNLKILHKHIHTHIHKMFIVYYLLFSAVIFILYN